AGIHNAKKASEIFGGYSAIIDILLAADQQSAAGISDANLRSGVELLNALNRQDDLESREVIETVLAAEAHDPVLALEVQGLRGAQARGEQDLQTRADANYSSAVSPALGSKTRKDAVAAMQAAAANPSAANVAKVVTLPQGTKILRSAVSNVAGMVTV